MIDQSVCDVAVIGAGLSGLTSAYVLQKAGLNVQVLEASGRIGGRIKSVADEDGGYIGDLGPSWVWPPYQRHVQHWMSALGVQPEPQFETGQGILDFDPSSPVRRQALPGQHGMTRLSGGPQALVNALVSKLPEQNIQTNSAVTAIEEAEDGLNVATRSGVIFAKHVVLSVPMRLAAEVISFPKHCDDLIEQMGRVPTWMANQCKVVIKYREAFWREAGLSGRVASQVGPMAEIHDHCNEASGSAALFGFVGIPFEQRNQYRDVLEQAILDQLERCFGPKGRDVAAITIEDWGLNEHICSQKDRGSAGQHPQVQNQSLREPHLDGKLHLVVAELAEESPGLIDGALQIGEQAGKRILTGR